MAWREIAAKIGVGERQMMKIAGGYVDAPDPDTLRRIREFVDADAGGSLTPAEIAALRKLASRMDDILNVLAAALPIQRVGSPQDRARSDDKAAGEEQPGRSR